MNFLKIVIWGIDTHDIPWYYNYRKKQKRNREVQNMKTVRNMIKNATDKQLLEMWQELQKKDMDNEEIAVNAIIETELEERNIIQFNEDTFEYELVK